MTTRQRDDDDDKNDNPTTKKPRKLLLHDIPTCAHYEKSFMHRQVVSHVVSSQKHGYVLTASHDGIVKFWKRLGDEACLEFAKSFLAHVGPVAGLCMSPSGDTACSVGAEDGVLKFYNVSAFDVTGMIHTKLKVGPHVQFLNEEMVAVTCDEKNILVYSLQTLSPEPIKTIKLHASPITAMVLNSTHCTMITADQSGIMELWDVSEERLGSAVNQTNNGISWKTKHTDTQLYQLMKKKTYGIALAVSPDGQHFMVYGQDRRIRLYRHDSGRIVVTYDERPKVYEQGNKLDAMEYGKRAATEREMDDTLIMTGGIVTPETLTESSKQLLRIAFDPSGKYILIPTLLGIKVMDWQRNRLVATIGKSDANHLRFTAFALCWGDAKINHQMQLARSGGSSVAVDQEKQKESDALLIALAYKQKRLYVFSHRDVLDVDEKEERNDALMTRDVLNEPPDENDRLITAPTTSTRENKLGTEAVLRTTMGDIHMKLFAQEVPRTIENFCGHARSGYYDNVIFHRIIKGFMLQTGDPLGDGTGGESIWGGEFEDEFVRDLRHDRPFTVSMANAGPGTNGSQFFITTVPTPWLDNKHTVFGRVTKGMDVCSAIENVKTDHMDKPLDEISIQSIDIM